MRYTTKEALRRLRIDVEAVGNISRTGSVRGMQTLYGWPKGGQVRIGAWIYNIGPAAVQRLRDAGELRG